jgi:hypothetical protein
LRLGLFDFQSDDTGGKHKNSLFGAVNVCLDCKMALFNFFENSADRHVLETHSYVPAFMSDKPAFNESWISHHITSPLYAVLANVTVSISVGPQPERLGERVNKSLAMHEFAGANPVTWIWVAQFPL